MAIGLGSTVIRGRCGICLSIVLRDAHLKQGGRLAALEPLGTEKAARFGSAIQHSLALHLRHRRRPLEYWDRRDLLAASRYRSLERWLSGRKRRFANANWLILARPLI